MKDPFSLDARVDDRIVALARVLLDDNLGRDVKIMEIHSVSERLDRIEDERLVKEES